jgi:alpha-ketoglutarate-dependent 2,4-dichlorophenoxyacetate dioxygenase
MTVTVTPLTPDFAARVSGLELGPSLSDAEFREVELAFERWSVLVFTDQPMDDERQIEFSARFGKLEPTLVGAVGAGSMVARMSNRLPDGTPKDPFGQRALFTRANLFWHSDSTFKEVPAKASLLSARVLPKAGGDTEFASTRLGYESLDETTRASLGSLVALHDIARSRRLLSPNAVTAAQTEAMPPVEQALVRTSPVTGRKSLLLASHIIGVVGMERAPAMQLISELTEHCTQPGFRYRHVWQPNDLVMWDNRSVLHRGHLYDELDDDRLLIRTTVAGAGPTAADGRLLPAANL